MNLAMDLKQTKPLTEKKVVKPESELTRRAFVARAQVRDDEIALVAIGAGDAVLVERIDLRGLNHAVMDGFLTKLAWQAAKAPWCVFWMRPLRVANRIPEGDLLQGVMRMAGFDTDDGVPLVAHAIAMNTTKR